MAKIISWETDLRASNDEIQLQIHKNSEGNLFVCLIPFPTHSSDEFIELSTEDAIDIISALAYQFNLIDDSLELQGKMMWNGKAREEI